MADMDTSLQETDENDNQLPLNDNPVDPRETRIAELEDQVTKLRDGMLRAVADLQNFRKRAAAEAINARETAAAEIAAKLLPVLDNFERTIEATDSGASPESLISGIKLVEKQLRDALESHNVKPIIAIGQEFDPTMHEAISMTESEHPPGIVIQEIEKGYKIGNKILRPSKVAISKGITEE